jgi:hypothetical protein
MGVLLGLFDDLTIKHNHSSVIRIRSQHETILGIVDSNWEGNSVLESDVLFRSPTTTEFSVANEF